MQPNDLPNATTSTRESQNNRRPSTTCRPSTCCRKSSGTPGANRTEPFCRNGFRAMVIPPTQKQLKRMKVKRNDPCPCGSGKKFKKCHMRGAQNTGRRQR